MSYHRTIRRLSFIVVAAGLSAVVMGQTKGSSSGRTSTPPPMTTTPPNQVMLMLSGNVIVEDGSALPGPVFIERVCNGRVWRDGHSDFKGYFSITINMSPQFQFGDPEGSAEMGGGSGLMMASTVRSRMPQNSSTLAGALAACELRASLAGFRSSSLAIPTAELANAVEAVNV